MLHDFITAHRDQIIERARRRLKERTGSPAIEAKLENGIPVFLTQLADALARAASARTLRVVGAAGVNRTISDSAALHGQDLLRNGFTVGQVVHGYGDVCQIVTELASETGAPISTEDFHVFNRSLDDAIAGAVTAFADQREHDVAYEGTERLGFLAHELRNLLTTAILSFDVIKKGMVGLGGSTGAIHSRSLSGLRAVVERSLAEVRLEAGVPSLRRLSVTEFIEEIEVSASMEAEALGIHLTVKCDEGDMAIDADQQLLSSAVTNLIQNALKFTRPHGSVWLTARAADDRVLIEVRDQCGGLAPGQADEFFRPFSRGGSNRSGLGLGLTIAQSATRANAGEIHVRDIPGDGCVFTIDLPLQPPHAPTDHGPAMKTGTA
jgi:signal transduction histidine kinase